VAKRGERVRVADLGEFGLIELLRQGAPAFAGVRVSIGDDAAIVDAPAAGSLLLTCDMLYEGVHFRREWYTGRPADLGRKALAVNISDIAAKAGRPLWCLVTLGIAADAEVAFLRGVYDGLYDLARQFGISVVGGDTIRVPAGLLIDIALIGETTTAHVPLRSDAKPGDLIAVTGEFGLARAGLAALEHVAEGQPRGQCTAWRELDHCGLATARQAQLTPPVRLREAQAIGAVGPNAMSDTSDGLAAQIHHICKASGVGAVIDADAIPVAAAVGPIAAAAGHAALDWALDGGEEYELIVTLPPERLAAAQAVVSAVGNTSLTVVGVVTPGDEVLLRRGRGQATPLRPRGFDHFAAKDR